MNVSPTEREWGALATQLEQLSHRQRNMQMVINAIQEEQQTLRAELAKLRQTLRTASAVIALTVGAGAWVVELFIK